MPTIDISRSLTIPGWMERPELTWLAEQAVEHKCIVEIGSYLGRSTRALLDHTAGFVYAIDDWYGPRDVPLTEEERGGLYLKFLENIQDKQEKLVVFTWDHNHIGEVPSPDMVFIDGSHEYQDVKRDIETWLPRIVEGGLLCGHDISFKPVSQAVKDTLGGDVKVAPQTTIWYKVL